jgi:hypothetical protein
LHVIADDHPAYRDARARLDDADRIRLEVHPNPRRGPKGSMRSAAARRRDEAMFPVDLLHDLLRHSTAPHKREGIAFGSRINALIERLNVFLVWRNFICPPPQHASRSRAGLLRNPSEPTDERCAVTQLETQICAPPWIV